MGASFSANNVHYIFSRGAPPPSVPPGVQFVTESIRAFAERLRKQAGKNIWMMGGGEIIGSFLDEGAIDEFIITVMPMFIGEGIPLIARRHCQIPLRLLSLRRFRDGVVQLHYDVQQRRVWGRGLEYKRLLTAVDEMIENSRHGKASDEIAIHVSGTFSFLPLLRQRESYTDHCRGDLFSLVRNELKASAYSPW